MHPADGVPPDLVVAVARSSSGGGPTTATLRVSGELDVATSAQLGEVLRAELEAGATTLVLDLADLRFCSASGLNVLLAGRRRARERGAELLLGARSTAVTRLLALAATAGPPLDLPRTPST